jgi:hypothetical protein
MCGKHLVILDITRKKQSFLVKDEDDEEVSAMNYVYNKNKL